MTPILHHSVILWDDSENVSLVSTDSAWREALEHWFHQNSRELPWRDDPTPYRVWVSEIMLQQTRVQAVRPYFERFMERFPTLISLAEADQEAVLKAWEGLGYYSRARNLHAAARQVMAGGGTIPGTVDELLSLPGIGAYTAAAVASIAFGVQKAVVDGNVLRVVARFQAIREDVRAVPVRREIQSWLDTVIAKAEDPSAFNQGMMELGALVCVPGTAKCGVCPVARWCEAFRQGLVAELPLRRPRKTVPHYDVAVGLVRHQGRILVARRDDASMLGGLWEFPGGKCESGESPEDACVREILEEVDLPVRVSERICTVEHAYSHFRITLSAFWCECVGDDAPSVRCDRPTRWVAPEELAALPFPAANHKIFAHLGPPFPPGLRSETS
ncbi:MAG: A/G-specific adenine glycosylase, partial [Lentisphaeria bacterium]|nr:A/G-specific adenine glycosylase [Lentisphaeria bacterium]